MLKTTNQTTAPALGQRAATVPRTQPWIVALLVVLVALLPRALAQGDFVTVDEGLYWVPRTAAFVAALRSGDFAATLLTGHPGVTTLWLGAAGTLLHESLARLSWIDPTDTVALLHTLRLPVALATSLCVGLAYLLLRRLLDARVALVAALLWASDPFLVAHGQLLHLDALLTSLMLLAVLALMLALRFDERPAVGVRWPLLVASAVYSGLALLTKAPALFLVPMSGLVVLLGGWFHTDPTHAAARRAVVASRFAVLPMAIWLVVAAATWVLLWPAAWVDLPAAVGRVIAEARDNGGSPHDIGSFFLGQAVADPGLLFYPVALVLRLTPWALLGLLVAPFALRQLSATQRRVVLTLVAFALLFGLMMTLPPKKFDRYILPTFPALNVVAAVGLWSLFERGRSRYARRFVAVPAVVGLVALVGPLALLLWYHPYQLAYYNPLVGGGPTAAHSIPVGWGEGYTQAAAYVTKQPDGCERPVAAWFEELMGDNTCPAVGPLNWASDTDFDYNVGYVITYIEQTQLKVHPALLAKLRDVPPVDTVTLYGIDYANVYQLPYTVAQRSDATFGDALRLYGYTLDTSSIAAGTLKLTAQWRVQQPVATDYLLFMHLLDANGTLVAQADIPPGGNDRPTSSWGHYHYVQFTAEIPVAPDLAAGQYWVALGLYDPASYRRLPLQAGSPPAGAPSDGQDALLLGPFEIVVPQ